MCCVHTNVVRLIVCICASFGVRIFKFVGVFFRVSDLIICYTVFVVFFRVYLALFIRSVHVVHLSSYLFAVCNVHHLGTRWSANRMLTPNHRFVVIVSYHSLNRVPILVINKYKLIKSDTNPCKSALFHMPRLADIIQPSTWFITNWNINFCSPFLSLFLFAHFYSLSSSGCRQNTQIICMNRFGSFIFIGSPVCIRIHCDAWISEVFS